MEKNVVIGKWAVENGLLDCWHEIKVTMGNSMSGGDVYYCSCGNENIVRDCNNPDYSIYEKLAPVLNEYIKKKGTTAFLFLVETSMMLCDGDLINLPTTLRDMVADLISKGRV